MLDFATVTPIRPFFVLAVDEWGSRYEWVEFWAADRAEVLAMLEHVFRILPIYAQIVE